MTIANGKMSGAAERYQRSIAPNHNPETGGFAVMADAHSTEVWKSVVGWPQYEVSNRGALRVLATRRPVGQWLNDQGYALVRLSRPRRMCRVHRLVAEAFIANPNNAPTVNHLNSSRADNRVENLEWCSQQENLAHAAGKGRMQKTYWIGRRSPNARLADEQVFEIRQLYRVGNTSFADLGRRFGVSKRTVGKCVNGETYV